MLGCSHDAEEIFALMSASDTAPEIKHSPVSQLLPLPTERLLATQFTFNATDEDDNARLTAIFPDNLVSRHQNVSILDFTGAKDERGGGDNWSYKRAKLQSNRHHQHNNTTTAHFYRPDALPVAQPTVLDHCMPSVYLLVSISVIWHMD